MGTRDSLFDLANKVAVVTGRDRGIECGIAEALALFGAKVVLCGRNQAALDTTAGSDGGWTAA